MAHSVHPLQILNHGSPRPAANRAERSPRDMAGAAVHVLGGRVCRIPSVLYFLIRGPKVGIESLRVLGATPPLN
ncbi:hypothetical protein NDU88_003631 [Pleurodeles waltl]|uniref:Uncharacterized protein n=1 Tax=Pleurodeles waltl TaxID=8319 RepID=A0AAV7MZ40_PLEWA|nr:hypothetical protein NDU88_003631 [Pleurodeles waltl]